MSNLPHSNSTHATANTLFPWLLAALAGHLTHQEFEASFLMSKELTIPTTWSESVIKLHTCRHLPVQLPGSRCWQPRDGKHFIHARTAF
jgi:hypothetical protein